MTKLTTSVFISALTQSIPPGGVERNDYRSPPAPGTKVKRKKNKTVKKSRKKNRK